MRGVLHGVERIMTQRERIMARVLTMPDESLPDVENCLNLVEHRNGTPDSSGPLLSIPYCAPILSSGDVSGALATRWDVLTRVQSAFKRIRGDRASTSTLYEAYQRSRPQLSLSRLQFHEILVEWSSPMVGRLGREEGTTSDDDQFWLIVLPMAMDS